jgi:Zn-finger nucleic acid-binding protein
MFVDLFGGTEVGLVDDTPTERVCPCCTTKMRACRINIDKVELDHDTLYCPRDGVWLSGGLLEHILVQTERESHRDFPGSSFSHGGPGLFDAERQEAYELRVQLVRNWLSMAWVALGALLALGAIAAAGWWCIISMCVIAMFTWWLSQQPGVRDVALRVMPPPPLTWVTALVRFIPFRFRLPA